MLFVFYYLLRGQETIVELFVFIRTPRRAGTIVEHHGFIRTPRRAGALDFLNDYKKTYKDLQKNPFYPFHDSNYRYLPFKKFPFIAFFLVDEPTKTVFLNVVFNTHRNPDKIKT